MKRKLFWSIPILSVLLIVLVIGGLITRRTGPVHDGKTADEWFFGDRNDFRVASHVEAAEVAFRAMGTNALPYLLSQLKQDESLLNSVYFKLYPKLPSYAQAKLPLPIARSDIHFYAIRYIGALGKLPLELREKVADRVRKLEHPYMRLTGMNTLIGWPASANQPMSPWEKSFLHDCLDDPNFAIRCRAASELARVAPEATNVFPVLFQALTDLSLISESAGTFSYWFGLPPGATNRPPALGHRRSSPAEMSQFWQLDAVKRLATMAPHLSRRMREELLVELRQALDDPSPELRAAVQAAIEAVEKQ